MKIVATLTFLTLCYFAAFSQIPNGGFENWENIQNYEKPLYWETNQDTNFVRFVKDTFSYEGVFSLKILTDPSVIAFRNCMSMASAAVKLNASLGENKSLYFYVKSLSDNSLGTTFLKVSGKCYQGQTFIAEYNWENHEEIATFTEIELPLTNPAIDSLSIHIWGGAINGAADGCHNQSVSWIDGFEIKDSEISNTRTIHKPEISVFPIPSTGKLQLKGAVELFKTYKVFDLTGRELESGIIQESKINLTSKGMLLLVLETADAVNEKKVFKVVNF